MFELTDKVALVTGSSRGIGRAIAIRLAAAGADVIVNSLDSEADMLPVVEQIQTMGRRAIAVTADVSDEKQVQQLYDVIQSEFDRLDILVNNAGYSRSETIFEMSLESWKQLLDNNLTSTFLCSRHAMEMMKDRRNGSIIQISSVVAHQGALYGHVHYAASKSAQLGFTKTLARTAAEFGITVNAIAPGMIATELLSATLGSEKVEALSASIPLGLGHPDDIANAVVFLSSNEAKYITGVTLDVNGGQYMR